MFNKVVKRKKKETTKNRDQNENVTEANELMKNEKITREEIRHEEKKQEEISTRKCKKQDEIKKRNGFVFEPLGIFLTFVSFCQTSFLLFSKNKYFPRFPFWHSLAYLNNFQKKF